MAICIEKYVNIATKTFDDTDHFMGLNTAKEVATKATTMLDDIRAAVIEFATENDVDLRRLHAAVTSEMGSKKNYRMQSIDFAKGSFEEYIAKVLAIPTAIKDGNVPDNMTLNDGFFERDRGFNIALFSVEDNECVPIPAEEAFAEVGHMSTLVEITKDYADKIRNMAENVPEKKDFMDGVYAKSYDIHLNATKLLAMSTIRFCALLLRHIVNSAAELFDHATADKPVWQRGELPTICWRGDNNENSDTESNRWAIFV